MNKTNQFVKKLVSNNPSLESIHTEHIKDYDKLLPYVFFGDLTRYIDHNFESHQDSVKKILSSLNRGLHNESEDVKELITVSFLENIGISVKLFLLLTNHF